MLVTFKCQPRFNELSGILTSKLTIVRDVNGSDGLGFRCFVSCKKWVFINYLSFFLFLFFNKLLQLK